VTTPPASRLQTVELFEDEHIVARGSARSTWHVRVNDGWVRARELPGARLQRLEQGPGSVWKCRIELELTPGTELLLTQSVPLVARKTPLAHLESGPGAGRQIREIRHRVGRDGRLERD